MSSLHILGGKTGMSIKYICFIFLIACTTFNSHAQSNMTQYYRLPTLFNDDGDGFIVIAHRGASAYYPENTMAAFRGAVEMNAEMIELDVLMSKDGIPVVFHDAHLNNHTNGQGLVSSKTLAELQELDAGSWFNSKFSGEGIPTLEEVLDFASGKIALNIEIKTEAVSGQLTNGIEQKSLQLVKQYEMEEHVLFSSFDYRAVSHLKQLDSQVSVALLYNSYESRRELPHELVDKYRADAFNCSYRQLGRKWMADIRKYQIPSFIYTVDRESRMRKLIKAGVNGIFTNKPDVLIKIAEDFHS